MHDDVTGWTDYVNKHIRCGDTDNL